MKRTYHFINESKEVEIEEKWDQVLKELDRLEYNNNHRETRGIPPWMTPMEKAAASPVRRIWRKRWSAGRKL